MEEEILDLEYMGKFIDEGLIDDFVNGRLKKSSMSLRDNYVHVIDFKKLLLDYIENNVSERSFICLDRKFFNSDFLQSDLRLHPGEQSGNNEEQKFRKSAPANLNSGASYYNDSYKEMDQDKKEAYQPRGLIS